MNPDSQINQIPKIENKDDKLKKLFSHCFELKRIDEGDRVPVGGSGSFFPGEANVTAEADFEKMTDFFEEVNALRDKNSLELTRKNLDLLGSSVDEKLFNSLIAFSNVYHKKYPANQEASEIRHDYYFKEKKNGEPKISDIFKRNAAQCAEIAALAQVYLQREGYDSTYFSGEVHWNMDQEYGEPHTFIPIKDKGQTYIYDPANPINTIHGKFPRLSQVHADFGKEMIRGSKRFVRVKDIIAGQEVLYGISDGSTFSEKDIAK